MPDDTQVAPSVMDRVFGGAEPQPEAEKASPVEAPAIEAKDDEPVKEDTTKSVLPDETLAAKTEPVKEQAKAEAKEEKPKAEAKAVPKEDKWESEENPYKKGKAEIEKQLKATRDWATQINQKLVERDRQFDIINKKLDGTYDPAVDEPKIDPQQVLTHARTEGAVRASIAAAAEKYGEEYVQKELQRFNDLFDSNPIVQQRVLNSPSPMLEALKVNKEWDITQKYGSSDVEVLIQKIKDEAIAELREQIRKEEHDKILQSIAMKNKNPNGLREVRQASGETKTAGPRPLSSFFHN